MYLFGLFLDKFVVGKVIGVDTGVVDAGESNGDGVSNGSGLVGGGNTSDLVVPVGFLALDADGASTLDGEFRGGGGAVAKSRGGKGRGRNGKNKKGKERLDSKHRGKKFCWEFDYVVCKYE